MNICRLASWFML